ncbi:hydantoinase B/oxoprolinase family protein [Alicyclobacillus cycloheptanicus]|uniref:N-methylhydantoinase B n=1 Tax=Alicyclobacillus cycloheptanicus TaxID=1457 RepID=A0ABT9XHY2_9BACL|nr:hydantoinase B/oxoprolinase family protein [Alicyclobacillus cycloheptanicus]MDQ0189911.1 N-methylhydantoinase B [Alicyclobacillus cycloheptanicus]WDM02186.1 hydantoinase B/oxoprolinase family protein [Alicyclobacillus cycloheptanicus]
MDPITLAVVKGRLEEIADEMDLTLYRSAFCPVIAEGHDACHGFYEKDSGGTIIQGKNGLPIFVGSMQFAVKAVIDRVLAKGDLQEGDVYIFNDPYLGGTHLQDVKLVKPFFYEGEHLFYMAGTGHWMDVGGAVPGGFNAKATEFFQEGFMVRPVKLKSKGVLNEDIVDIFLTNSRLPRYAYGDLYAQLNALEVGERRLRELFDQYGKDTILGVMRELRSRSARLMKSEIAKIPDGTYSFEDWLDNDGIDDVPLKIAVDLTIAGDRLKLDFSRTSPPCRGPLNIAYSTAVACCYVALKQLFPEAPANAGCFEPVDIHIPDTTLLNVQPPRPVGGYLEVILRVIGVIFGAMSQAAPERSYAAPYGTVNCLAISGEKKPGENYIMFMYYGGGLGGSNVSDGLNHGSNPISTASITPLELVEAAYPLMFTEWSLRPDSFGAGRHRGGLGANYEIEVLGEEANCFFLGDRGKFAPFGVLGGESAALNRISFRRGVEEEVPPMVSKVVDVKLSRGHRVRLETPGGGGYGPASERAAQALQDDVDNGYVTTRSAI